ncbi:MAG: transposase family protein [Bacteroidales bacterium]|nr:transposase family protein [Bacteroidales bacterium]
MADLRDIIIKQDTIWISEAELIETVGVTANYLKVARHNFAKSLRKSKLKTNIKPDTGKAWRYARINNGFYYDYDRIPDRMPAYHRSKLPTRSELITQNRNNKEIDRTRERERIMSYMWKEACEIDQDDVNYFTWRAAVTFSPEKAIELATARSLANLIKEWVDNKTYKKAGIHRKEEFWTLAAELTGQKKLEGLRHDTAASLRKKLYYEWPGDQDGQRQQLISGRYGNQNRAVVGKYKVVDMETGELMQFDIHEAIIYNVWMNPGRANKLHKTQVYDQYLNECKELGIDAVSERTVQFHLNKFANRSMMSYERDGKDHFSSNYKPYIPQFKPNYAGTMWVADYSGTKLMYRYRKEVWRNGRKTSQITSASWYMLRIVDVATDYIVSWGLIREGENWQDLLPALNMALEQTDNCPALELVTDNGPAFTSAEAKTRLSMLFKKHRRIQVGNKQANKAETYVRLLSDKARKFDNWARLGFHSRHADNVANPDYMDINKLPWQDEAARQAEELVDEWNNTARPDGSVPAEEYAKQERRSNKLQPVDDKVKRFVFGHHSKSTLDRCRGVLSMSLGTGEGREQYLFEFNDWLQDAETIDKALYGEPTMKVKVIWDFTGADIYTPDGRYILTARPAGLSHSSEFEATKESTQALKEHTRRKVRYEEAAKKYRESVMQASEVAINPAEDLDYLQRASLNGGRAKAEHNKIMEKKQNPLQDGDNDTDFDVRDSY